MDSCKKTYTTQLDDDFKCDCELNVGFIGAGRMACSLAKGFVMSGMTESSIEHLFMLFFVRYSVSVSV